MKKFKKSLLIMVCCAFALVSLGNAGTVTVKPQGHINTGILPR